MAEKNKAVNQKRLLEAAQASQAVVKDAAGLSRQAAVLKSKAVEARLESQQARAQRQPPPDPAQTLLTIPEAARRLHIAERTLRHVLAEPPLHEQLIERTRKIGIYYKFVPLLPPDLIAHLALRFAQHKPEEREQS